MIFKVQPVSTAPEGAQLVDKGIQFGFFGKAMVFEVTSTVVPKPFPIKITALLDPEKSGVDVQKDAIDASGLNVRIINPHTYSPTSLTEPGILLRLEKTGVELAIQFVLTRFTEGNHFVFTYAFYERPLSKFTPDAPKGSPA